jgi:hypothetical protein
MTVAGFSYSCLLLDSAESMCRNGSLKVEKPAKKAATPLWIAAFC